MRVAYDNQRAWVRHSQYCDCSTDEGCRLSAAFSTPTEIRRSGLIQGAGTILLGLAPRILSRAVKRASSSSSLSGRGPKDDRELYRSVHSLKFHPRRLKLEGSGTGGHLISCENLAVDLFSHVAYRVMRTSDHDRRGQMGQNFSEVMDLRLGNAVLSRQWIGVKWLTGSGIP